MVNDDKPILRIKDDGIYVCGTPWCGKHGLQTNVEVDESMFSDEIRKLDELKNKVAAVLKQALGVAVRVKLVEPKTIERSEGKAKRVIDNRKLHD